MSTIYEPTVIFGNLEVVANLDDNVEHGDGEMKIGDTCTVLSSTDAVTDTGNALQVTGSIGSSAGGLNINGVSRLDHTIIVTDDATGGSVGFDVSGIAKISLATSDTGQNDAILLDVTGADSAIDINTGAGTAGVGLTVDSATGATNTASGSFNFTTGTGGPGGSGANAGGAGDIVFSTGTGGAQTFDTFDAGVGGDITFSPGAGGNATVASENGGASGSVIITTLAGGTLSGTGTGTAGADGVVDIDTVGAFTVDVTAAGASIDAAGVSNFTTTGANNTLTLQATNSTGGNVIISAGGNTSDAIQILAETVNGGINMTANNLFNVDSTTVEIDASSSFSIDGNAASNISVAADATDEDLTISVTGNTNSSVIISSEGTGSDSILLRTITNGGSIDINSMRAVNISSNETDSSWTHTTTADSQGNLTISTSGAFNSELILQAGGNTDTALQILAPTADGGVNIDASDGGTVHGGVDIASRTHLSGWTHVTDGSTQDLTIAVTGVFDSSLILSSEGTGTDAISIIAADAAGELGGINVDFGSNGLDIDSLGGLDGATGSASGGITMDTGVGGNGSSTTGGDSGGMTFQTGTGGVGTGANTSGDAGDIILNGGTGGTSSGATGTGGDGGTVQINSGAGGAASGGTAGTGGDIDINSSNDILADASNSISLDAAAASNFSTSAGDLTLDATAGSATLSGGEAVADAVQITSTNVAGGIDINGEAGGIDVDTGIGADDSASGIISVSSGTGGVGSASAGGDSGVVTIETGDGGAGTVATFVGGSSGDLILQTGTGGAGQTTGDGGDSGDIDILAGIGGAGGTGGGDTGGQGGDINIQPGAGGAGTTSGSTGTVFIGTDVSGAPVSIGHTTSETTVNDNLTVTGDLTVSGTTTTINTQTLEIDDNIILVNSGPGALGEDGGIIVRRYQKAEDDGSIQTYDVTSDTGTDCVFTNIASAGAGTSTTITFTAASLSSAGVRRIDQTNTSVPFASQLDFFAGWWLKVTTAGSLTNNGAIHRIKSSTAVASPVCTIYGTADNVTNPDDGLDFVGSPDGSTIVSLYPCPYVSSLYNESQDEWQIAYTATEPTGDGSTIITQRFSDLRVANLNADTINNNTPDTIVTVVLIDDQQGVGSSVAIGSTNSRGAYLFLVEGADTTDEAMAVFACTSPSDAEDGHVQRISHVRGSSSERINIHWPDGSSPKLYYSTHPGGGTGANRNYSVKIVSV